MGKKILRSGLASIFLAVIGLLFIIAVWAKVENSRNAKKAAQMLHELSALALESSSEADSAAILEKYGFVKSKYGQTFPFDICLDSNQSYDVSLNPKFSVWITRSAPLLVHIGIVPGWQIHAALHFRNGQLSCINYAVYFPHAHASGVFAGGIRPRPRDISENEPYQFYFTTPPDVFGVSAFPSTNQDQKDEIFRPDLSCLSRLGGCRYPCEMSALWWQRYKATADWQHIVRGYGKPPDDDDARCSPQ